MYSESFYMIYNIHTLPKGRRLR